MCPIFSDDEIYLNLFNAKCSPLRMRYLLFAPKCLAYSPYWHAIKYNMDLFIGYCRKHDLVRNYFMLFTCSPEYKLTNTCQNKTKMLIVFYNFKGKIGSLYACFLWRRKGG